jgi:hypothetical protein
VPTIGNLPAADVEVTFPDGTVKTVNVIRVLVQTQNAEFKAKHGMFLPNVGKLHPTVGALRKEYPHITARTWAEAAEQMRQFHTDLSNHITEGRTS